MATTKLIPGLTYGTSDVELFKRIDELGGWPVDFKYVGFVHTTEREAGFCNTSHNTGYWSVVACADDYYLWKLSPEALQRVVDAAVAAVRLTRPVAHKLHVNSWRGWSAPLQQPPKVPA